MTPSHVPPAQPTRPVAWTEAGRQAALDRYRIVDTPDESDFDDIARIAAQICRAPIALISLLDRQRQWFKARLGLTLPETPRGIAFCEHAIKQEGVFEVTDAQRDRRFRDNPLVTGEPGVRFYAGAPIVTPEGFPIGTLCVLDRLPHALSDDQRGALDALARQVMAHLELRRAAADLHREDERQRLALQSQVDERIGELARVWANSQDIMLAFDPGGEIKAVAPTVTKLLGWTADELLGHSISEFIHVDDLRSATDGADDPARDRTPRVFRNRYRTRSGGYRWLSWATTEENGRTYAYGRDVTGEVEQLTALGAAEERLRQSQKMEAVGQLTSGLAHDFNNLLTGIGGSLELLQSRVAEGRYDRIATYAAAAQDATRRATALTRRLLAFSRRQPVDLRPTDVDLLVREMADLLGRTIGKAITLAIAGSVDPWRALVDPNQLENAILNLCLNARDAMPDGGRITIETSLARRDDPTAAADGVEPGEYLVVCVADTGTGMTPDVVARAFDPFFTTKPAGEGTGLGLSMTHAFARACGGRIGIDSTVGHGTRMRLYLPRHDAAASPDAFDESAAGGTNGAD